MMPKALDRKSKVHSAKTASLSSLNRARFTLLAEKPFRLKSPQFNPFRLCRKLRGRAMGLLLKIWFAVALTAKDCHFLREGFYVAEGIDWQAEGFAGKPIGVRISFGVLGCCFEMFKARFCGKWSRIINSRGDSALGKFLNEGVPVLCANGVLGENARIVFGDYRKPECFGGEHFSVKVGVVLSNAEFRFEVS